MMRRFWLPLALVGLAFGCNGAPKASSDSGAPSTPSGTTAATATGFVPVGAVLTKNCVRCHGEGRAPEGIRFTSYANLMAGGKEGPVVKAGDPEGSVIVHALRGSHGVKRMPPNTGGLAETDIQAVEAWIKAGAKEN